MSTHDQLIASVLNLRADFESLRNTEELKIKTRGQELIIDRLKVEVDILRSEKLKHDGIIGTYHRNEVALTSERDVSRKELAISHGSIKRLEAENTRLLAQIKDDQSKRQKLRKSYTVLNRSFPQGCEDTDVIQALDDMKESLMETRF